MTHGATATINRWQVQRTRDKGPHRNEPNQCWHLPLGLFALCWEEERESMLGPGFCPLGLPACGTPRNEDSLEGDARLGAPTGLGWLLPPTPEPCRHLAVLGAPLNLDEAETAPRQRLSPRFLSPLTCQNCGLLTWFSLFLFAPHRASLFLSATGDPDWLQLRAVPGG